MIKKCIVCGEEKNITEFHRNRARKDGRSESCKVCKSEYNKRKYKEMSPLERSICSMARGVITRTRPNGKYAKRGIKNLIGNTAEIENFLAENFSKDIQIILDNGETPSIDRRDSKGHYEPGNVRVIPHWVNSKLSAMDRRYEREEKKLEEAIATMIDILVDNKTIERNKQVAE